MQSPRFRFQLELLSAVMSVAMAACSSSTPGNSGSGGDQGSGGKPGSGGQPATGGTSGTAGNTGSGGATTGSGGQTGTGGKTGGGGTASTGGAETAGGTTSAGGSTGAGGETTRDGGPGRDGRAAGGSGTGGSGAGGSTGGGTGGSTGGEADGGAGPAQSAGCGKTPSSSLKNSPSNTSFTQNNLTVSGTSRQFIIRWPDDYKNTTPYRLIIGLHGAGGKGADVAGATSKEGPYFGLWDLSKGSTIFIAPSAGGSNHYWDATSDTAFVKAILELVEGELCIDTSRVMLEGFSQGAAMSWTLACGLGGFRAAVGHSGGGVANPTKCDPIAYFGSGGTKESVTQTSQSDQFAKWDGCTIETFAAAPSGGHACNDYKNCSAGHPVRWCPFDDSHMPDPADSGKSTSWMPSEVWPFISQF